MLLDSNIIIYASQPQNNDLRQLRKMTLGDALIAATALVHQLTIVTHNQKDFVWIPNLSVIDPVDN